MVPDRAPTGAPELLNGFNKIKPALDPIQPVLDAVKPVHHARVLRLHVDAELTHLTFH